MGALWSTPTREYKSLSSNETRKRRKLSSFSHDNSRLIPNLPDEISIQIFARIPRINYFSMRLVSQNWKTVLTSPELFNLRKELGVTEEWLYLLTKRGNTKLEWYAIDPLSKQWQRLPPIPSIVREGKFRILNMWNSYIFPEFIKGYFRRKNIPTQSSFSGCGVGTLHGCLYVLGGFSQSCAMSGVWRYNPIFNNWDDVAPMMVARAYCKTSVLNNKLYVIGGVTGGEDWFLPLQSGEVFDPCTNTWSEITKMPCSKAHSVPTPFMVDMLKPIATGISTYRGRIYVPQSLYSWPFLVDVGGEVYDPDMDTWQEMPIGMGEDWPTRQAGTKYSVVVDGELYSLDTNSGKMKVYDEREDAWKVVIQKVPFFDILGSDSPYLLASIYGMIHVITKDADRNAVISQADICNILDSESPDTVVWKVITSSDFGPAELVCCQVLDI